MLSRLSRTASRLVDLWNDIEDENDDDSLTMSDLILSDVHALSHSIRQDALETASNVCEGLINPLYRYVESSINADIDTVVRTLYESDPQFATLNDSQEYDDEDIYLIPPPPTEKSTRDPDVPEVVAERNSYSESSGVSVDTSMPSADIPVIIVTPAPPQLPETTSWVPIQDTCFGARLTVPTHFALNAAHPPMLLSSHILAPLHSLVRGWTYKHGHWCALVPGLDEQERRGIFSRPFGTRRRTSLGSVRKRIAREVSLSSRQQQISVGRSRRDP